MARLNPHLTFLGRLQIWGILLLVAQELLICGSAYAQIIPDNTLGSERSHLTPNTLIRGGNADQIDGGAVRGSSLFHSFEEFNVNAGQRVYFANPAGVTDILTRITGANASNIQGTLGVDGNANLFLLNPHGVIFGPHARLDISGSLTVSTGDRFRFADGTSFSARDPQAPLLLAIHVPIGLQLQTPQSGTITNYGVLTVGQDLALIGDRLDLTGQLGTGGDLTLLAQHHLRLRDAPTQPLILGAGGNLLLQGNQTLDIDALHHPDSGLFANGNLTLRSLNPVGGDAHYWSGGQFRVEQLNHQLGTLYSPHDPVIRSLGDVSFNTYLGASLHILAAGSVKASLIGITAPETGTAGTQFLAETVPVTGSNPIAINGGARPTLDIRAGVAPAAIVTAGQTGNGIFFPTNPTLTTTPIRADINVGGIALLGSNAANGLVLLTNQYRPNPTLAGDINVGLIITTDNPRQFSDRLQNDLRTVLENIGLLNGFRGDGGDVILDSRGDINLTGQRLSNLIPISSTADPNQSISSAILTASATGRAGDVVLRARDQITIDDESTIFTDTNGRDRGGNIDIQAESFYLGGKSILAATSQSAGQGGNITINTSRLTELAERGTFIATSTFGRGANDGNGGDINITTRRLLIRDGAFATTSSEAFSRGRAGNLTVNASGSVDIIQGFGLAANTNGFGDAGNLTITTPRLQLIQGTSKEGSGISVSSRLPRSDAGRGGNLVINSSDIEIVGNKTRPINTSSSIETAQLLYSLTIVDTPSPVGDLQAQPQISGLLTGSLGGQAGSLTLNLGGSGRLVVRDGAGIATVAAGLSGNGGDLVIHNARLIELSGLGGLASPTFGSGRAGNIRVEANEIRMDRGALITVDAANPLTTGAAGRLMIRSDRLTLLSGAQIRAGTVSSGQGGSIQVRTTEGILASGTSANGQIPSGLTTATTSSGSSGNINIRAGQLLIQNGAEISTSTTGSGRGGNLVIQTPNLVLANQARLSAATAGVGEDGGNITIWGLNTLLMRGDSLISAEASGDANGGSINIDARNGIVAAVPSENNDIVASANRGNGGQINITTQEIFGLEQRNPRTPLSDINASSEFGLQGTVTITRPDIEPDRGLVTLPTTTVDASRLVAQRCLGVRVANTQSQSEFVVTGRGGLPATVQEMVSQDQGWQDWRNPLVSNEQAGISDRSSARTHSLAGEPPAIQTTSRTSLSSAQSFPIVEAQGWIRAANGEIALVAPEDGIARSPTPPTTCGLHE